MSYNKLDQFDESGSGERPELTIIIPTFEEAGQIGTLISYLEEVSDEQNLEIIVVDAQSSDGTPRLAGEAGARVVTSLQKGRAVQMNVGADAASADTFYFLHADTYPPKHFDRYILESRHAGYRAGSFRLGFDMDHPLLRFYSWFTKFDFNAFRFGDQSLYIDSDLFRAIGGFDESLKVMEDNEIIYRIKQQSQFNIMTEQVTTSARRYKRNGILRLQLIFTLIYLLHHLGVSQHVLTDLYMRWIK